MRTWYALFLAVLFLFAANVRADMIFSLQTGGDWIVKHYGTFGTGYYGQVDNSAIIGMINNAVGDVGSGTRVYDQNWELNFLHTHWNLGADDWRDVNKPDSGITPWIGIWNGHSDIHDGGYFGYVDTINSWNLPGYYTFETTFALEGSLDKMIFDVWNDNDLMAIYLTNNDGYRWEFSIDSPTAIDDYKNSATAVSINDGYLGAGEYTLTFYLMNGLAPGVEYYGSEDYTGDWRWGDAERLGDWLFPHGPVGLRVEGSMEYAAIVPEPATFAVLGLGLAGLGLARARRKKASNHGTRINQR